MSSCYEELNISYELNQNLHDFNYGTPRVWAAGFTIYKVQTDKAP